MPVKTKLESDVKTAAFAVIEYLKDAEQFKAMTPNAQMFLAVALSQRDLLGVVKASVAPDLVGLVMKGLLSDPNFAGCCLLYALGIANGIPTADGGGGQPKTVESAEATALESAPTASVEILQALSGLKDPSPALLPMLKMHKIVDELMRKPCMIPAQQNAWVN